MKHNNFSGSPFGQAYKHRFGNGKNMLVHVPCGKALIYSHTFKPIDYALAIFFFSTHQRWHQVIRTH